MVQKPEGWLLVAHLLKVSWARTCCNMYLVYRLLTRGTPTADSVMCEGIVVIYGVTVLVAAIARVTDATDPAAERIMGGRYYVGKVFYDDEDRHSFAAV